MKPRISGEQKSALLTIGSIPQEKLSGFQSFIKTKISRLSMEIEYANNIINGLQQDLEEAKGHRAKSVGEYENLAAVALAYLNSQKSLPPKTQQERHDATFDSTLPVVSPEQETPSTDDSVKPDSND